MASISMYLYKLNEMPSASWPAASLTHFFNVANSLSSAYGLTRWVGQLFWRFWNQALSFKYKAEGGQALESVS